MGRLPVSLMLGVLLWPGCSNPPEQPFYMPPPPSGGGMVGGGGAGGGNPDGGAGTGGDAAVPPVACATAQMAAGDHDFMITAGGMMRTYHVHVPPALAAQAPAPLLLNLHPFLLNGPGQATFSNMNPAADARGVIVAYPDGISNSWNGGSCCGTAAQQMVEDVAFLRAV